MVISSHNWLLKMLVRSTDALALLVGLLIFLLSTFDIEAAILGSKDARERLSLNECVCNGFR